MVGVCVANGPHIGAGGCVAFADIVGDADSGVLLCTAGSSAFIFCDWGKLLRFSLFGGSEPSPDFPLAEIVQKHTSNLAIPSATMVVRHDENSESAVYPPFADHDLPRSGVGSR